MKASIKPGITTTEFWLCALAIVAMVVLAAIGALNNTTALSSAAVSVIYTIMRSVLKTRSLEAPEQPENPR